MQKFLMIKIAVIGCLCVLFLVGLSMVSALVDERKSYEKQVLEEIAQTQIGEQVVATPFLVMGGVTKPMPILPNKSEMVGDLSVKNDQYARGIYKAVSYQGVLAITQSYAITLPSTLTSTQTASIPPTPNLSQSSTPQTQSQAQIAPAPSPAPKTATLVIPVLDLRGVSLPTVTVNGKPYSAQFAETALIGLGESTNYLAVHFDLPNAPSNAENAPKIPLQIAFELPLSGLSSFGVIPLGKDSTLKLTGDWREPKFHGNALPIHKHLNETGFLANWQNPFLSEQNSSQLVANFKECRYCSFEDFNKIRTDFVTMDNVYVKTDRTIKYALILLLVSFGTFFLFEVIKGLKIHPIQYLLVSAGLLTFYVLLLSFAELIAFWQAYLIASVACVGLISWYTSFLLKSIKRSVLFGGILGSLYAGFYAILSVGEMNLLLGAIFCFMLLFAVMFITRKIDWYQITDNKISVKFEPVTGE